LRLENFRDKGTPLQGFVELIELSQRLEGTYVTACSFQPAGLASGLNRNNGLLKDLAMTIVRPLAHNPPEAAQSKAVRLDGRWSDGGAGVHPPP
jgi:hypothetical protein